MSKRRRTVSLDEEVDEHLDEEGINASALANKLLREHFENGGDGNAILNLRIEQVQSEIDALESQLERKREELQNLERRVSKEEQHREDALDEALAEIEEYRLTVDADHQLVEKLGREQFGGDARAALDALIEHNDQRNDPLPEARFDA